VVPDLSLKGREGDSEGRGGAGEVSPEVSQGSLDVLSLDRFQPQYLVRGPGFPAGSGAAMPSGPGRRGQQRGRREPFAGLDEQSALEHAGELADVAGQG